jgi:hypothetical protein
MNLSFITTLDYYDLIMLFCAGYNFWVVSIHFDISVDLVTSLIIREGVICSFSMICTLDVLSIFSLLLLHSNTLLFYYFYNI